MEEFYDLRNIKFLNNDKTYLKYVMTKDIKYINNLISIGFNIYANNNFLFKMSIINDNIEIFKFFLENGINYYYDNNYPIKKSSEKGSFKIIKYLIDKDQSLINECLNNLCFNGHFSIIEYLFDNYDIKLNNLNSIEYAVYNNNEEIVKYLISKGIDISVKNKLLLFCINNNNLELIKYLVDNNCYIDNNMVLIINKGNLNIIKYFFETLNFISKFNKEYLLDIDYINIEIETFEYLYNIVENDITTINKNNLLKISVAKGNLELVRFLIFEKNTSINNNNLVNICVNNNRIEILKYLIKLDIDIQENNNIGLINSLKLNNKKITKLIINNSNILNKKINFSDINLNFKNIIL